MRKLFALTAIVALAFTACDLDGSNGGNGSAQNDTTLVIRNQSFSAITDVIWDGINFGNIGIGGIAERNIPTDGQTRLASVHFRRTVDPIHARTQQVVAVEAGSRIEFTFLNTTIITSVDQPALPAARFDTLLTARGPLALVRVGSDPINHGGQHGFGSVPVLPSGRGRELTFTVRNFGTEEMVFNGAVSLTDNASGYFSVVRQPLLSRIAPGGESDFVINFNPSTTGVRNANVMIRTNCRSNSEFVFRVEGTARAANTEARLDGLEFSRGVLWPDFHRDRPDYYLRIEPGHTAINVRPIFVDPGVSSVTVNGRPLDARGVSESINPEITETITITVTAEDGITPSTYTVRIREVRTWQRLHGQAGGRFGIHRAISNGQGGIYAGGWIDRGGEGALFNIGPNGEMLNIFPFASAYSPVGMIAHQGRLFSVLPTIYVYGGYIYHNGYYITSVVGPGNPPHVIHTGLFFEGEFRDTDPRGIGIGVDGLIYVAGNSWDEDFVGSIFVHVHDRDGNWLNGTALLLEGLDLEDNDWTQVRGMALLPNRDVLVYGEITGEGTDIAFAAAINTFDFSQRWVATYSIPGSPYFETWFNSHFFDGTDIVLLGGFGAGVHGGGGFVVRFPITATTAAAASPAGWPRIISRSAGGTFASGLAFEDGYLFVGRANNGPNGGEDVWLVKTGRDVGEPVWERFFGGAGDEGGDFSIVEVPEGFILAGETSSPSIAEHTINGEQDIYIIRINRDGTLD